jgi:hypothetical protein
MTSIHYIFNKSTSQYETTQALDEILAQSAITDSDVLHTVTECSLLAVPIIRKAHIIRIISSIIIILIGTGVSVGAIFAFCIPRQVCYWNWPVFGIFIGPALFFEAIHLLSIVIIYSKMCNSISNDLNKFLTVENIKYKPHGLEFTSRIGDLYLSTLSEDTNLLAV